MNFNFMNNNSVFQVCVLIYRILIVIAYFLLYGIMLPGRAGDNENWQSSLPSPND